MTSLLGITVIKILSLEGVQGVTLLSFCFPGRMITNNGILKETAGKMILTVFYNIPAYNVLTPSKRQSFPYINCVSLH